MKRRAFVAAVARLGLAVPLIARAEPSRSPVIGFLSSRSPREASGHVAAFREGLKSMGYVDGQNATIDYRFAAGDYARLPALARDLLSRDVTVLAAVGGSASALAARGATTTVPTVVVMGDDPVRAGLVASYNRPGGNLTGVSFITGELGGKRLALICEMAPQARTTAYLRNPNDPDSLGHVRYADEAARVLKRRFVVAQAGTPAEIDAAFGTLAKEKADALVVENDAFFDSQRDRLVELAARHAIPAIYHIREYPDSGGLMSYGASLVDAYRQVGVYVGQILKGASPAELPIVRPTTFELVINAVTAKSLGLSVPRSLAAQGAEIVAH